MVELFEVGDVLKTPQGTVIAGTSEILDKVSHDELSDLLSRIKQVDIVSGDNEFTAVPVRSCSVTTSLSGRRNIFVLIGEQPESGNIAVGAKLRCADVANSHSTG